MNSSINRSGVKMPICPVARVLMSALLFGIFLAMANAATWWCVKQYQEDAPCQPQGCVAQCRTKQFYWNGLPITLHLGLYTLDDVYSYYTGLRLLEYGSGSSLDGTLYFAVNGEDRSESDCAVTIASVMIFVPCFASIENPEDPCPTPLLAGP